jgi:hypothetical protein
MDVCLQRAQNMCAPNSAMSSFVSGIIREPLAGIDGSAIREGDRVVFFDVRFRVAFFATGDAAAYKMNSAVL